MVWTFLLNLNTYRQGVSHRTYHFDVGRYCLKGKVI